LSTADIFVQGGGFSDVETEFFVAKTSDFSKIMVCPQGQKGKGLRQCGYFSDKGVSFVILCGRLL